MVNVTVSTAGIQGPPGNTVRHGTGAPAPTLGVTGDWYIDNTVPTALIIYGPKTLSGWGSGVPVGGGAGALLAANNLSDLNNDATARTNLGLGNAATLAVGTTAGTVAAGDDSRFPQAQPWMFNVAAYGAVGDGQFVTDGAMASGSAVLTSASARFANAVVGMPVMVKGGGVLGQTTLVATVASKQSDSQITLSAVNASGGSISSALVMWGTDDTPAIQSAINAALAYAGLHGSAQVYIPVGAGRFYVIAGALVSGGSTLGNSQLTLGVPVATTLNKVVLDITGVANGSGLQHWQQLNPQLGGSTLVSFGVFANPTAQASSINANGNPAVIGGPAQPGGYGVSPGVFSNMLVTLKNLSVLTAHSAFGLTYSAFDFSGVAEANLFDVAYGTTGSVAAGDYGSPGVFATGASIGGLMPANGNNDNNACRNISVHGGYTWAFWATEHTVVDRMVILYCWSAFCPVGSYFSSVGATHAIKVGQLSVEACTNVIYVNGGGSAGVGPIVDIGQLDTESGAPVFTGKDANSMAGALGTVKLTGLFTPSGVSVSNPTGLKIRNGQAAYPVVEVAANYQATVLDDTILVDATTGPVTVTLISAAWTPNSYTVKKIDSSANVVTVATTGGQTIDGATTKTLTAQWQALKAIPARVSSNWNWYTA